MFGSNSTEPNAGAAQHAAFVGVDIGGGSVKSVIMASEQIVDRSVQRRDAPIDAMLPPLIEAAVRDHGVAAAGVGIAGLVDHHRGRFVWGPHLADAGVDVSGLLRPLVDTTVVDNDANCAAYAEWVSGAAAGRAVALTVSVGTGIGAGLIADGEVWRGAGFAGEVGHMRVGGSSQACPCGRRGCWETLVSGRQLGLAAERLGLQPTAEALVRAAAEELPEAIEELRLAGDWLGIGVANLMLAFDPEVVVVAGGVSLAGDLILDAARDRIASALPGRTHRSQIDLVRAEHGRWAAAIGAAHLAAKHQANGALQNRGDD